MSQSFCWQCGRRFARSVSVPVTDPVGNVHRVHKICEAGALEALRTMPYQLLRSDDDVHGFASAKEMLD